MIGKYEKKQEPPISVEPHLPDQKELNRMGAACRRAASRPVVPTTEDLEKQIQRRIRPWRESAKAAAQKRRELRAEAMTRGFAAATAAILIPVILIQLEVNPLLISWATIPVALVAAYQIGKSRRW